MSGREERPARVDEATPDEPFLSRWARLKKESRERPPGQDAVAPPGPAEEAPRAAEADAAPDGAAAPVEDASQDVEPAVPELPSLDSLTEESDFAPFMHSSVDPALRRSALRKMFRNPKYAIVDPLDPYRADYGAFTALGDTITSDMKFHAERLLRAELEKAAEAAERAGTAAAEDPAAAPVEGAEEPVAAAAPAAAEGETEAPDDSTIPTEDGDERRNT
jgi:hypothetical protein